MVRLLENICFILSRGTSSTKFVKSKNTTKKGELTMYQETIKKTLFKKGV